MMASHNFLKSSQQTIKMLNETAFQAITEQAEQAGALLVAVTKQRPISVIERMYELGHRDFGENRVEELLEKQAALPKDINWHFIGHLQRNKVKKIAPFVHLVHGGDSPRLLRELNKQAVNSDRHIRVLLQYHIAEEESKYGLDAEAPDAVMQDLDLRDIGNLLISGVMGMATYTTDEDQVAAEFGQLHTVFAGLKKNLFADNPNFRILSMGMSGDYEIALRQGSNLVRVGSALYE